MSINYTLKWTVEMFISCEVKVSSRSRRTENNQNRLLYYPNSTNLKSSNLHGNNSILVATFH